MAIFDRTKVYVCEKCGHTTFTEQETYMYDKTPDNKIKRIEITGATVLTCARCNTIQTDTKDFFKNATIIK